MALLQRYESTPNVKVIALGSRPDVRNEALVAGADVFISKRNPPDELLQLLKKLRNGRRAHCDLERREV